MVRDEPSDTDARRPLRGTRTEEAQEKGRLS